jgi:hypothetical protein
VEESNADMSMDVLYEINFPDGRCWTTTALYSQAVDAAKAKAKKDSVPMEVVKHNLRTERVRRNTYFPDGTVEKHWKGRG